MGVEVVSCFSLGATEARLLASPLWPRGATPSPCPAAQTCDGSCAAGYFCPAGSTNSTARACGNASVLCPPGAPSPTRVSLGHYSLGGTSAATNTAQLPCPPGTYCVDGAIVPCPTGRWGNADGGASTVCPNNCTGGNLWCVPCV